MLDALPRVASLIYKDRLIVGHGSGIEVLEGGNIEKRTKVFEENGSNVYGIVAAEDGIYVHGENNLAFIKDSALLQQENCPKPEVQQFHDHILCLKVLSQSELVILFTCNSLALYDRNQDKLTGLALKEVVRSEHSAVLLRGLIVGDSWQDVYTVVGTVFGLILVSRPSQGGGILRKYTGHTGMIFDMVLADGLLFTVSDDRSLRIWEFSTEKTEADCQELMFQFGHSARPFAICARDDLVFTAGIDQTVYKWKHEAGKNLRIEQRFCLNIGCIRNLVFFENNLYCCSENGGLVSFNPNLPSPIVTTIPTCEDLRGFARCAGSLYAVNGRGQLFENGKPILSHLNLRHLIASPLHEAEQYAVAYGERSAVVIHGDEQKLISTDSRILSCVCSSGYTFIYTADKIGILHNFETSELWRVSFEETLNSIGKTRPFISSSMCIRQDKSQLTVLIGSVCGHLMTILVENDQTTSCYLSHKIDRNFKGEQLVAMKSSDRLVSCLVKKVGIVEFEWIEEKPCLKWKSTRSASSTITLDSPSGFIKAENRNFLVGFHSTDFHLLDEDGLALFSFTCGGANRPWMCYLEEDSVTFEFLRHQQLIRVSQLLLNYTTHQSNVHKSQIVFINCLLSANDRILCCTGSNDTSMCFTSIQRDTGKWSILRRIHEAAGFICCDSRQENEKILLVTGSGKGKIVLWRIENLNYQGLESRQIAEYHHREDLRILDLQFGPSDRLGAVLCNGTVEIFTIVGEKLDKITDIPAPDLSLFTKIRWLGDSSRFVAISTSGKMCCWELSESGVSSSQTVIVADCGLSALEVTDCFLLVGDEAGHVTIFEDFVKVQTLAYHSSTVTDIKFDPRTSQLFSTSLDCRLAILGLNKDGSNFEFNVAKSLPIWDPSELFVDRSLVIAVGSGITSLSI